MRRRRFARATTGALAAALAGCAGIDLNDVGNRTTPDAASYTDVSNDELYTDGDVAGVRGTLVNTSTETLATVSVTARLFDAPEGSGNRDNVGEGVAVTRNLAPEERWRFDAKTASLGAEPKSYELRIGVTL